MIRASRNLVWRFMRVLRRCALPQKQRDLQTAIERKRKAHKPSKREREKLRQIVLDDLRAYKQRRAA